jgi:hypothetical protein
MPRRSAVSRGQRWTRELWPFYLAALTVVALFAYVPALTLH